jgi:phosphoserine phosphatase
MEAVLKDVDCVCLDVDSTVVAEEGIDALADAAGVGERVAALTKKAMEGGMTLQDALAARLDLIKPSRELLDRLVARKPPFTEGIQAFVAQMHSRNVPVFLVSGGFRQMLEPIARELKIPSENVFANVLLFEEKTGEFVGLDRSQPTSKQGGKAIVIRQLKDKFGFKKLVLIGDGITDLEAKPPADVFIGFGGVSVRPKVQAGADKFIYSFRELLFESK